ncbi:TetR family transcriptional regulator [Candidatus Nitrosoglobus terrae]|uniref:TetR family transcriptional regulator n=1 Tax=Candidatus Nitrosoglobus terrae TaxID=1630141 RepID=A0A1Q2SPF1_9GAMM|nr:TetR family transcriptional regulator [Candidatus Nitrosoglobus terrae]BAW80969.1 TetR family transcriptional regulator [Candidatus Nitrosoglobus terrae]
MVRRTKEDAQETRENILEAASIIFVKKGVAKASLEEIAQEARVTRGAIYWHFKNKMDIFQALHDQLYKPLTDMILQDLEKGHPNPLKQLEELCVKLLIDLEHNAQKKRILTIFFLKCDYSGEMEEILRKQNARKIESFSLFTRYFERAQHKKYLPPETNPKILTLSISCYLTGIAQEYIRNRGYFSLEEQGPAMMRQFFAGFSKKV